MVTWASPRFLPERKRTPSRPVPAPAMEMLRSTTLSLAPALTTTPLTPAARMPARVPSPLMVIALLMVMVPKPPGSRTEISPPAAVFDSAPANVLQGAVRLQGLASLPTPDTQVRGWPAAAAAVRVMTARAVARRRSLISRLLEELGWLGCRRRGRPAPAAGRLVAERRKGTDQCSVTGALRHL